MVVLIGLEAIALLVLLAFALTAAVAEPRQARAVGLSRWSPIGMSPGLWALLLFPFLLGVIHLTPFPLTAWAETSGRGIYIETMRLVGQTPNAYEPLSLNPQATWTSLLAALPLLAGVVLGFHATVEQIRSMGKMIIGLAMVQVMIGLLQLALGGDSFLYYDGGYPDSAIGTFANRSHYANFLIMAMCVYLWVAFTTTAAPAHTGSRRRRSTAAGTLNLAQKIAWTAGGLLLAIGVLISRSRGAALTGLPVVLIGWMAFAGLRAGRQGWRTVATVVLLGLVGAVILFGVDFLSARYVGGSLGDSASFRKLISNSTFDGAMQFWPWGAGWGTYEAVYPRFQPQAAAGYVEHAHNDYAQLLFEGGIFAATALGIWVVLYLSRAVGMLKLLRQQRTLENEPMLVVVSGLALLAVMSHAWVEFNLHIPANAVFAAFLAGIYLRPIAGLRPARPRI